MLYLLIKRHISHMVPHEFVPSSMIWSLEVFKSWLGQKEILKNPSADSPISDEDEEYYEEKAEDLRRVFKLILETRSLIGLKRHQFGNQSKTVDRWRYMEWNHISSNEIDFGEYYKRIRIEYWRLSWNNSDDPNKDFEIILRWVH